jgi:phosphoenolpyruvate carboxylase
VGLNIGSRPASRTASRKIEDLRAIPWVFSWSQARFMLPGWYGFASGVERAGLSTGQLQDLAGGFDFFGALLSNMELALAQSHMGIAARYRDLSPTRPTPSGSSTRSSASTTAPARSPWRSAAARPCWTTSRSCRSRWPWPVCRSIR